MPRRPRPSAGESVSNSPSGLAWHAGAGLCDDKVADAARLGDLGPTRITVLHLRANDVALEVRLDTLAGGHTYVRAADDGGYPAYGALRRLAVVVEGHKRRLGPELILTRLGWNWLDRMGPSVVSVRDWDLR